MAKSALLEQYSDIWFDKQEYLEAERIYYEGKLSGIMGRKNKNKSVASGAVPLSPAPSPAVSLSDPAPDVDKTVTAILAQAAPSVPVVAPVSPAPVADSLEPKKRNDSESSNKSKKGKGGKGQPQAKQEKPQTNNSTKVEPQTNNSSKVEPKTKTPDRDTHPIPTVVPETKPDSLPAPTVPSQPNEKKKGANKAQASNEKMDGIVKLSSGDNSELVKKIAGLESENKSFKKDIQSLQDLVKKLENRINSLEIGGKSASAPTPAAKPAPAKPAAPAPANGKAADDDDVDLFGSDSDEESEEAKKIREDRLAAYNAKKSKKPVLIAKSNIILDVKPWGDDTDMKEMEKQVRAIEMDGLLWGASKLAPLAYGINKLQISCVVEDEKVSVDALTESIQDIEDYVQSVDIAAFNKV